jgi:hypothetical protein
MEMTETDKQDAVEYVYAKSWRVRFLVGRSPQRKAIVEQIAQSVYTKCCALRATADNADAVYFESRQQLKDAVGFWPIVIQILLPIIIKLLIDWFINKQDTQPQPTRPK